MKNKTRQDTMRFDINEIILRFPHMIEQLLQKLDNKGLARSREVSRTWQKLIDRKMCLWLRIVNIPTILSNGNTYPRLAAKHGQIDITNQFLTELQRTTISALQIKQTPVLQKGIS